MHQLFVVSIFLVTTEIDQVKSQILQRPCHLEILSDLAKQARFSFQLCSFVVIFPRGKFMSFALFFFVLIFPYQGLIRGSLSEERCHQSCFHGETRDRGDYKFAQISESIK